MAKVRRYTGSNKIVLDDNVYVHSDYFVYKLVNDSRKYVGSFTKSIRDGGNVTFHIPEQGSTWKRDAAMNFNSIEEAQAFIKLVDPWKIHKYKLEERLTVNEW